MPCGIPVTSRSPELSERCEQLASSVARAEREVGVFGASVFCAMDGELGAVARDAARRQQLALEQAHDELHRIARQLASWVDSSA